jgi:DNA-binding NarL/FixJ family response regulator
MRRQHPDALTSREREVLDLVRRGLTNEEIADRLGISLDGAKYHISQILSKLRLRPGSACSSRSTDPRSSLRVATREEAAAVAPAEQRRAAPE